MIEQKQNKSHLVSIIIPCYNDAQFIEQAINSAKNQTYPNKEIIVIDDGSNIETKRVLKSLESKISKLITQGNRGQSAARNVGITQAKGDYIMVLDSDDYFESSFCEKAMSVFLDNKEVKIISSLVNRVIDNKIIDIFKPNGGNIQEFILNNEATGSCMFLKSEWIKVDGYDESMSKGFEDWEFYIRLLKHGGIAYIIQEPLFYYRLRIDSTTSRANKVKYDLLKYIYIKHTEIYKNNFDLFISHLLNRIEREEREKTKNTQRLEFKIGKTILKPFRWIKSYLR